MRRHLPGCNILSADGIITRGPLPVPTLVPLDEKNGEKSFKYPAANSIRQYFYRQFSESEAKSVKKEYEDLMEERRLG